MLFTAGNKSDLENIREVPYSVAQDYAEHHHMLDALETSAKENSHIEDAFVEMAKVSTCTLNDHQMF